MVPLWLLLYLQLQEFSPYPFGNLWAGSWLLSFNKVRLLWAILIGSLYLVFPGQIWACRTAGNLAGASEGAYPALRIKAKLFLFPIREFAGPKHHRKKRSKGKRRLLTWRLKLLAVYEAAAPRPSTQFLDFSKIASTARQPKWGSNRFSPGGLRSFCIMHQYEWGRGSYEPKKFSFHKLPTSNKPFRGFILTLGLASRG